MMFKLHVQVKTERAAAVARSDLLGHSRLICSERTQCMAVSGRIKMQRPEVKQLWIFVAVLEREVTPNNKLALSLDPSGYCATTDVCALWTDVKLTTLAG